MDKNQKPGAYITIASKYGHLDVVKWFHDNWNNSITREAMDYASENGHLEVAKWLHENRTEGCTEESIMQAIRNNYNEIVQFIHEKYGFEIPQ